MDGKEKMGDRSPSRNHIDGALFTITIIDRWPSCASPFLLFENSKAVADFDTKAVSKIDQKWRILTRRRSVKSISWNEIPMGRTGLSNEPDYAFFSQKTLGYRD